MVERSKIKIMEAIKKVLELIKKSINCELSLNELYQGWPENLKGNKFYEIVYDDVESSVEHYPSQALNIFGKENQNNYFKNSYECKALKVDLKIINIILQYKNIEDDLIEIRELLLEKYM